MPRGQRAPNQTQISISLDRPLLADINRLAAEDERSRSKWIVRQLRDIVAQRKRKALIGLPDLAPHGLNEDAPVRAPISGPRPKSTRGIRSISRPRKP